MASPGSSNFVQTSSFTSAKQVVRTVASEGQVFSAVRRGLVLPRWHSTTQPPLGLQANAQPLPGWSQVHQLCPFILDPGFLTGHQILTWFLVLSAWVQFPLTGAYTGLTSLTGVVNSMFQFCSRPAWNIFTAPLIEKRYEKGSHEPENRSITVQIHCIRILSKAIWTMRVHIA